MKFVALDKFTSQYLRYITPVIATPLWFSFFFFTHFTILMLFRGWKLYQNVIMTVQLCAKKNHPPLCDSFRSLRIFSHHQLLVTLGDGIKIVKLVGQFVAISIFTCPLTSNDLEPLFRSESSLKAHVSMCGI